MKSILLASASIFAFAGAASAEVTFGGSATLGYNDTDNRTYVPDTSEGAEPGDVVVDEGSRAGFYWSADLGVTMSQELDNGLTASASFGVDIVGDDLGMDLASNGFALSLTSDSAGLHFGDVDMAAQRLWSGVSGMSADGFGENGDWGNATLRGDIVYGGVDASISYGIADGELLGMQLAATATFGNFNIGAAYQDDADTGSDILGVSLGTSFGGADVSLAYADDGVDTSIGVAASYPVGPVTVGAYFAMNDPSDDEWGVSADYASGPLTVGASYDVVGSADGSFGIEGTYDVGNNITALFGLVDSGDAYYVAGSVDMGGGASLLVSYAESTDDQNDEIGGPEYLHGITAEVGFSF